MANGLSIINHWSLSKQVDQDANGVNAHLDAS